MFAKNVIEFRRGIQDPLSANEFQVFMMDEINSGTYVGIDFNCCAKESCIS